MARLESVSLGGYYKTPTHLLPRIAALVEPLPPAESKWSGYRLALLDPCAGEGEAALHLLDALAPEKNERSLYAVEMEEERHKTLCERAWQHRSGLLQGDAFLATWSLQWGHKGVSLLFLNPPYDHDREHRRLEQRFLARFGPALAPGGVLLFLVPHYALAASAETLARDFDVLDCRRFPDDDFPAYKQVVLVATRRADPHPVPDAGAVARIDQWVSYPESCPELPLPGDAPVASLPRGNDLAIDQWRMAPLDLLGLARRYVPWTRSTKQGASARVATVEPPEPLLDVLRRVYPVATPPRPSHIAAGIASGLFNGERVSPNADSRGWPDLLVKGVFDKEYRTVDEKLDKDGNKVSELQVQQPKLVVTVLDLRARRYHALGSSTDETRADSVAGMTVADLLARYGDSLMGVMRRQCPVLYDPRRDEATVALATSTRARHRPFTAQAHAVRAVVRVLRERSRVAVLLGEIGVGKSLSALLAARSYGARRVLVLCPPHLLAGWRDQVALALPGVAVRVLSTPQDVDAVAQIPPDRSVVSLLTREAAKLGHGWRAGDAAGRCPRCGGPLPKGLDAVKARARCQHVSLEPLDEVARIAATLAWRLAPCAPDHPTVEALLGSGFAAERRAAWAKRKGAAERFDQRRLWSAVDPTAAARALLDKLAASDDPERSQRVRRALVRLLGAVGRESLIVACASRVAESEDPATTDYDSFARDLALLLPVGTARGAFFAAERARRDGKSWSSWSEKDVDRVLASIEAGEDWAKVRDLRVSRKDGHLSVEGAREGTLAAALSALSGLAAAGLHARSPECGEPLYQAVPEPRRYPLAKYVARRHPRLFDFLVADEAHEYAGDGTAQSHAASRLQQLGLPTIQMTGTVMNGYASSLFQNAWLASAAFRREFRRSERQKFVDRYGYRKRVVEDRADGKVVAFGTQSDRVIRSERAVGDAPGVLPLFVLRHLLPIAVTLHKADLAIDLPPLSQERHLVEPTPEQRRRYERLLDALKTQIRRDRFVPGKAGKLFGQLSELPSYLDRCVADAGNADAGAAFEIRYPEECGGDLVAREECFAADTLAPKEEWLVDRLRAELAEGRRAMVFAWHLSYLPRLQRVIQGALGEAAPILWADKVPTAKRQDWIDREVVKKNARVMVANPVAIQTGLNNLVHFSTEIWVENPAVNATVFRQAIGRIDRIGQRLPTRVLFPVYAGTLQEALYDLLAKKVAVAVAADGLDHEAALAAAGVGDSDALAALSIGRQLWKLMNEEG